MKKEWSIYKIAFIGIMAAFVFVASKISFPIPTAIDQTRIHLGNVLCLLSGLLLGPVSGGLAAGIGSAFYDVFDPKYIASAPFTFVFKFLLAYVCGTIAHSKGAMGLNQKWNLIGAILGQFTYVVLYLSKSFIENVFYVGTEVQTALLVAAQKGIVSSINAVIAVVVAVPLCLTIVKILDRSNLRQKIL